MKKEIAPSGSKFFLYTVEPFSKGDWCAGKQTESHKSCLPCEKGSNINPVCPFPLKNIPMVLQLVVALNEQGHIKSDCIVMTTTVGHSIIQSSAVGTVYFSGFSTAFLLTLVLLNGDIHNLCKQCRFRSTDWIST